MITASCSPCHFSLPTCSDKVKGIRVLQRDMDSASICQQTVAQFWESHSALCLDLLLLMKWDCWAPFSFGGALKTPDFGFCMSILEKKKIFFFALYNCVMLLEEFCWLRKKWKEERKVEGDHPSQQPSPLKCLLSEVYLQHNTTTHKKDSFLILLV